jgi:hypothetical protein
MWCTAALRPPVMAASGRLPLLVAYCLMARRSALVAVNGYDSEIHEDGSDMATFERLKTEGPSDELLLNRSHGRAERVARRGTYRRGGVRLDCAAGGKRTRITPQSVGIGLKQLARMLSLPELDPRQISSHSARIPATQHLAEDGASDAAMMRDAGWKTPRTVGMCSPRARAKQGSMAARLERLANRFAPEAHRADSQRDGPNRHLDSSDLFGNIEQRPADHALATGNRSNQPDSSNRCL